MHLSWALKKHKERKEGKKVGEDERVELVNFSIQNRSFLPQTTEMELRGHRKERKS